MDNFFKKLLLLIKTRPLTFSCCDESFEKSWLLLGNDFATLRSFSGSYGAMFPNTSSVESDFSLINYERNSQKKFLQNLAVEGILQCKQFSYL